MNKSFLLSLTVTCMSLCGISCSNDDDYSFTNNKCNESGIEVSKMSNWCITTRADLNKVSSDMQVLKFKDQETYNETVKALSTMSSEEVVGFFNKIGFDGAYTALEKANQELDVIFEIEDEELLGREIAAFKEKYKDSFEFNQDDKYDATPYLKFTDKSNELVGNLAGYVVIGNTLKKPELEYPEYKLDNENVVMAAGTIEPGFKAFKNASLTIKNGGVKSTMTIGRIVNGNSFAIQFKSKKKQLLWWKSVSASYSMNYAMTSSIFHNSNVVTCPKGAKYTILWVPIEAVGNVFNAEVTNFKSSKGNAVGNKTFNNLQVI